jgi:predicted dehydrogenase
MGRPSCSTGATQPGLKIREHHRVRNPGKIRYAVVGLGHIAQVAVLPAFPHAAANSELVALVSDDPVKRKKLGQKYNVNLTFSYDQYDDCLNSGEIDAVYIALPNNLHHEFSVRAARAGIHILCEKPMAVTEKECEEMIKAANASQVKLMIAYRLHFEKANLKAVEIAQSGKLGDLRFFSSVFTMQVKDGNIRLKKDLGGGTLYDIGIYCINAARYLFRAEPTAVFACSVSNNDKRFQEVDEMTSAVLRFPGDRLATFTCSFGSADISAYEVVGTRGELRVEPAYEYIGDLKHRLIIDGKSREKKFPKGDQFAPELIYFSECIRKGLDPEPSGVEGLADVRVIRALYRSAEVGRALKLGEFSLGERPGMDQQIRRPPVKEPKLVRAQSAVQ